MTDPHFRREARIGAVILAAGAGTRLGGVAKALLVARSQRSFLACIADTARSVNAIVVVGPPHGELVAAHARDLGLRVVVNPHPERGMASSIALGFAAIAEAAESGAAACGAAWLWPVDHPEVASATLGELIAALGEHAAARPVVDGRGGHPPLISRLLWHQLAACADRDGGARAVLAAADTIDVPVEDRGCIRDVDTVSDLEAVT